MKFKKITSVALSAIMVTSAVATLPLTQVAAVAKEGKYEKFAAELDQKAYTGKDLGATYTAEKTTFKVWAPTASNVDLNLFATGSDKEEGAEDLATHTMSYDEASGIWSMEIAQDLKNVYYTYSVTVDGKTKETGDIYAKATGVNGDRSMVVDLDSTDPDGWSDDNYILMQNATDANVWEVHVKDFSYDASSGVSEDNRGKYLAFTESGTTLNNEGGYATGVDYLKEMGIKYVHINPFYDYASVDEAGADTQYNWGYDPKNYNVPEGSYSSNPYDGNVRINETKQMVKALHDAGIGVVMDVVYNHTYNTDSVFQKTVPNYYYRYTSTGALSNGSGCGNDTASEHAMFGKFMVESVKYWAEEYHIDGFRFDLMGLHDVDTMNAIRDELDTIDSRLMMYGEGWTLSTKPDSTSPPMATQKNSSQLSERIAFFNDQIRDGQKGSVFEETGKGYLQGRNGATKDVVAGITANAQGGNWTAKSPLQTVTYASAHDNHTMYDRFVMSVYDGKTKQDFSTRYEDLIAMNKLSAAITFTSQGMPFILAGEEMARTKYGDHNSYMSSPEINKIDWNRVKKYQDLTSYYAGMIELRDAYSLFRTPSKDVANNNMTFVKNVPDGVIAYTIQDQENMWKNVAVMFNNATTPQEVTLEGKTDLPTEWAVLVNDQVAGVQAIEYVSGTTMTIPAQGALILVDKESYVASEVTSNKGTVVVEHKNADTGEVMSKSSMTGAPETAYETESRDDLALEYDLVAEPENKNGVFAANTTIKVVYEYKPFKVEAKDITGDDEITIADAVEVSKMISKIVAVDMNADVDKNGRIDIHDVVSYQKALAKIEISGISYVKVNYIEKETGKEIASSTTIKGRLGNEYKTTPKTIDFYQLDETSYPEKAEGIFEMGTTEITYYYTFAAEKKTVKVKLQEGQTWVPNIYSWLDSTFSGEWPGTPMELGEDGWYTYTIECGGTYNFIINKGGSKQTIDLTGYTTDVWAVLNVAEPNKGDNDVTIYTSEPTL